MLINSAYAFWSIYVFYVLGALFVKYINERELSICLFLLVSIYMGWLAFINEPNNSMDLSRYYQWIYLTGIEYHDVMDAMLDDSLFLRQFIFYMCSKTEYIQLFSAVPTFCGYFFPLYILYDFAARENISLKILLICGGAYIFANDFILIASSVRFPFVSIMFIYFYYLESMKKIRASFAWGFYVLLSFFHSMGIILIFIRLLVYIKSANKKIYIVVFFLLYGLILQNIFEYFIQFANIDFIFLLLNQTDSYLIDSSSVESMGGDIPKFMYYSIIMFATVLFLGLYKKYNKSVCNNKFFNYFLYDAALCMGSISMNMEIVSRFSFLLLLILIMLVAYVWENTSLSWNTKHGICVASIVGIGVMGLIYTSRFYPHISLYLNLF